MIKSAINTKSVYEICKIKLQSIRKVVDSRVRTQLLKLSDD